MSKIYEQAEHAKNLFLQQCFIFFFLHFSNKWNIPETAKELIKFEIIQKMSNVIKSGVM